MKWYQDKQPQHQNHVPDDDGLLMDKDAPAHENHLYGLSVPVPSYHSVFERKEKANGSHLLSHYPKNE